METNQETLGPKKQPQVERRLKVTLDTINNVLDRTNQLDDRLQGVLLISVADPEEKKDTVELVPVAQEIKIIGEIAEQALEAIESIIDRLEL